MQVNFYDSALNIFTYFMPHSLWDISVEEDVSAFYLEFGALDIFVELFCNPNHRFRPHLLQSIFFSWHQGEGDCRWNHGQHALPREGVPGNLGEDQVPREAAEAAGGQGLPHPIPRIQVRLI